MSEHLFDLLPSPLGVLRVQGDGEFLTALSLHGPRGLPPLPPGARQAPGHFAAAAAQLRDYFAGRRTAFDLPLRPVGTPFQHRVWAALQQIPYGQTLSYGELAQRLGQPGGARAVGLANGQNPLAIVVPCHRVIGANGALTGYAAGLAHKRWLLAHEASHRGGDLFG
jgi:methylated-DNA-[protein]-cysteine S-methyltransferase